jgi:thiol-disulfide isomerase/thioredoxin
MLDKRPNTAPELYGVHWLNGQPLMLHALQGHVVLLFFWDYTCIRSLRLLEYIKELEERYREAGLTVIGVHSPGFAFAGDIRAVERAIYENNIAFPVVMDYERNIFDSYHNTETPSVIIIDKDGVIRERFRGRGKQISMEKEIQICLRSGGVLDTLPAPMHARRPEEIPGVRCFPETPQMLFGYLRGNLGNSEGFNPESVYAYDDPGLYLPGRYYLKGVWKSGRHSMTLERTVGSEGYIVLQYEGQEVFAVLGNEVDSASAVEVTQDDQFLTDANRGDDVRFDRDLKSVVTVEGPRLLHLVRNEQSAEHVLKLSSRSAGMEIFSLTFIPGIVPELFGNN